MNSHSKIAGELLTIPTAQCLTRQGHKAEGWSVSGERQGFKPAERRRLSIFTVMKHAITTPASPRS